MSAAPRDSNFSHTRLDAASRIPQRPRFPGTRLVLVLVAAAAGLSGLMVAHGLVLGDGPPATGTVPTATSVPERVEPPELDWWYLDTTSGPLAVPAASPTHRW
jgi:hypothetical protein